MKKLCLLLFLLAAPVFGQYNFSDPLQNQAVRLDGGDAAAAGTVTSVGISMPLQFNIANSPVTSNGTIDVTWVSQAANTFLLSPAGASGIFTARTIDYRDLFAGWVDGECLSRSGANIASGACSAGSGAPTNADYLVGTANGSLSAEIVVGTTPGGELGNTWASPTIDDGISITNLTMVTPILGTPQSGVLTNATGLPLSTGVTGDLPLANLAQASAESKLLGRGEGSGAGDYQEITLGTNLTMSGTTINASAASGAPTDADYLVGTSNGSLSAEIVVGTTPGGELGNTWASPTLDDSVAVSSWTLTSSSFTTSFAETGDPADAGAIRLNNASNIAWEAAPAGTDVTLGVDSSEILQASGTFNAGTLTEGGTGVPNTGDKLSVFAATSSSELFGVVSDETGGTGVVVGSISPALVTPAVGNGATGPGSVLFKEDSDNGTNSVTLIGPASTADVTLTLPAVTATVATTGTNTWADGVKQTFNPDATLAGINVGSQAGDPGTPANGDIWYDSTAETLDARINGATVSLGAGGGGDVATDAIWDAAGDLAVGSGANTAARLAIGAQGTHLSSSGSAVSWADPFLDTQRVMLGCQWMGEASNCVWGGNEVSSGTGADSVGSNLVIAAAHPFARHGTTGTTTTGRTDFRWGPSNEQKNYRIAGGPITIKTTLRFEDLSTTATEQYTAKTGMCDQVDTDCDDGIYFYYDAAADTHWLMNTANGGTRTSTATDITVSADTWYRLEIRINSAATSVEFFIDGVSKGTLTTNIPTVSVPLAFSIIKSAGTTARLLYTEYYLFEQFLTSTR